jgi:hypothetical protein
VLFFWCFNDVDLLFYKSKIVIMALSFEFIFLYHMPEKKCQIFCILTNLLYVALHNRTGILVPVKHIVMFHLDFWCSVAIFVSINIIVPNIVCKFS